MNAKTIFAYHPHDSEEVRLEKFSIFILASACSVAGAVWAVTYYEVLGWKLPTLFASLFPVLVGGAIIIAHITKAYRFLIYTQIICIIYIPAFIEWSIGGIYNSGFIMVWSFLGPLCALMFFPVRQSILWLFLFLVNLAISMVFTNHFIVEHIVLSSHTKIVFFALNLGVSSVVVFLFASYYVHSAIQEEKRNNELLNENLQQELILRQHEKLATLGKLSAGIAHELNNPAAANLSSVEQLKKAVVRLEKSANAIGRLRFSADQKEKINKGMQAVLDRAKNQVYLSVLESSDREYEIENWLEAKGMENAWEVSQPLVKIGYSLSDLEDFEEKFDDKDVFPILEKICHTYTTYTLIEEIGQGSVKITELVKALKSYSYLDQGPKQSVDIHKGLNDTLIMLQNKLKMGVHIEQEYEDDLPHVYAYGSELNQVWTNLIDNAVSAMNGHGKIKIKTYQEGFWLVIEIIDNGPGIPGEVLNKIFDPFFTTKKPGEGTGLGLSISYNIITQKHKGQIKVFSKPGETCFQVKLPINNKA